MRAILLFFLMTGIVVAKPPEAHPKKNQTTAPVQSEKTPLPTPDPVVPQTPASVAPASAETPASAATLPQSAAPEATPAEVTAIDNLRSSLPEKAANGIRMQWFGHAFIYLTSANGIRVALDPFTSGTVKYQFPQRLPADVALVSCENEDRTGTEELFGSPILFRSVTGVGLHVSNGLTFRGIESWRDDKKASTNTIYIFTMDTVRFCALGNLGYPLNTEQRRLIGKVDVLFVSVGNRLLRPSDLNKVIEESGAKWIVPVAYLTAQNNTMDLRPIEEFDLSKYPVEKVTGNSFVIQKDKLPTKPTLLMLESP